MRRSLTAAVGVATACWTWHAWAAERPTTALSENWIRYNTSFKLAGGRVVNSNKTGYISVVGRQITTDDMREQVSCSGNGTSGSTGYSFQRTKTDAQGHKQIAVAWDVEVGSDGHFVLRYSNKDEPQSCFEYRQLPGQPVRLSLPQADKPRVFREPTLWHLLIIHDAEARQTFLPMLEGTRFGGWPIANVARAAEDELVKLAATAQKSDGRLWAAWVEQLGDPLYTRRDRADRNLREAGEAALGYLSRLDRDRLDAEQQSRVRRIIRVLSARPDEDTPQSIAAMMINDADVWLALLCRRDEAMRRAAVRRLEALSDAPVKIDPAADPATTGKAREELRQRIEKLAHDGARQEP